MNLTGGSETESAERLRRARIEGGIYRLPPATIVRMCGTDAFRYLNGQVTRDLSRAMPGGILEACVLTPKGRLCAVVLIAREGEEITLECAPAVAEDLVARLERYIVADEVSLVLERAPERIHLFGAAASRAEIADSAMARSVLRLGVPGIDLPEGSLPEEMILRFGGLLDSGIVESLRIERAIPEWGKELDEQTLPPEAGLDRTHIDYDRGCYPGQEVISRLRSIGRVNRLLHVLRSSQPLSPGMLIRVKVKGGGVSSSRDVGRITSAIRIPGEGDFLALGYVAREAAHPLEAFQPSSDPLTECGAPISIVLS